MLAFKQTDNNCAVNVVLLVLVLLEQAEGIGADQRHPVTRRLKLQSSRSVCGVRLTTVRWTDPTQHTPSVNELRSHVLATLMCGRDRTSRQTDESGDLVAASGEQEHQRALQLALWMLWLPQPQWATVQPEPWVLPPDLDDDL